MGCTLIRMKAFETIEKPYFKTRDDGHEQFLDGVNKAECWTEDLYFCDKVTKAGWKVYADGSILCKHWKDDGTSVTLPAYSLPCRRATAQGKRIVDLGAGESPYATDEGDVITVDIREDVKPDYRCDLRVLPFGTREFDVVFSSHTLEHFGRDEVSQVLDEWVRILKPEGELRLVLPSVKWAAERILAGALDHGDGLKSVPKTSTEVSDAWHVMNVLYGQQTYRENFHRVGFTPESVTQMLRARGFTEIEVKTEYYNIYVKASGRNTLNATYGKQTREGGIVVVPDWTPKRKKASRKGVPRHGKK